MIEVFRPISPELPPQQILFEVAIAVIEAREETSTSEPEV